MPDTEFKIIAIKPLKDCKEEYLKILAEDQTYFLYSNYEITANEELVKKYKDLPSRFFHLANPHIEVNAVVGKNGSGKSTLMELFIMAINNLACRFDKTRQNMVLVRGVRVIIYFKLDGFHKLVVDDDHIELFRYSEKFSEMRPNDKFNFRQFFYTVVVNYSHYAYNEMDYPRTQRWLTGVFHKNDGYQVPIVLNPFRSKGNIDINSENHLVKARLTANLLRPSTDGDFDFRMLTDKYRAAYLTLTLDPNRSREVVYELPGQKTPIVFKIKDLDEQDRDFILHVLNDQYKFGIRRSKRKDNELAVEYIFYKLVSICLKYQEYNEFFNLEKRNFEKDKIGEFLEKIIGDPSHIAYKLKQTLNFIRFGHIDVEERRLDLDAFGKKIYGIMEDKNSRVDELIELLPPPIFRSQIMVQNLKTKKIIPFVHLSSGEKQWNYSVSSFLYHLNNLDSVPTQRGRIQYSRVLLILEEVELYFHPEMQRCYIQHVIKSVTQLHLNKIKKIQIFFVTHSPFILSDIPEQNILFLDEKGLPAGEEHITKTFGGNIHELLAKSFFLDKALVGEFARKKIESIIKLVQLDRENNFDDEQKNELEATINLIGEEYLREKLLEMFNEKYNSDTKENRIRQLEDELRRLRND